MDRPLPDLLAPDLSVVFCGLNPGLDAAASGHHFAGRSNRFWRVMHLAGFTPKQLRPEDDRTLLDYGCGLTTVVARATAGADALATSEFVEAAPELARRIAASRPRHLAFLGKAAYAAIQGRREILWGPQADAFAGARVWVLPNPSGRNRAFTLKALVDAYRPLHLAGAWDRPHD